MVCHSVLGFLGGSVGAGEWVVLFVVVLIVVGPKRLPAVARKVGRTMEMFRRAADEFKDQLLNMDQETPSASTSSTSDTTPSDTTDNGGGYENPYPETADYPGNEDQVQNWFDGSEGMSPETERVAGSESAPVADAVEQDKPAEQAP